MPLELVCWEGVKGAGVATGPAIVVCVCAIVLNDAKGLPKLNLRVGSFDTMQRYRAQVQQWV